MAIHSFRFAVLGVAACLAACSSHPSDEGEASGAVTEGPGNPFENAGPVRLADLPPGSTGGSLLVVDDQVAVYPAPLTDASCVETRYDVIDSRLQAPVKPLLPKGAWRRIKISPDKAWVVALGAPGKSCPKPPPAVNPAAPPAEPAPATPPEPEPAYELYVVPVAGGDAAPPSLGPASADIDFLGSNVLVFQPGGVRVIDLATRQLKWTTTVAGTTPRTDVLVEKDTPLHTSLAGGTLVYSSSAAKLFFASGREVEVGGFPNARPTGVSRTISNGVLLCMFNPNGGYDLHAVTWLQGSDSALSVTSNVVVKGLKAPADYASIGTGFLYNKVNADDPTITDVNVVKQIGDAPVVLTGLRDLTGLEICPDGECVRAKGTIEGKAVYAYASTKENGSFKPLAEIAPSAMAMVSADGQQVFYVGQQAAENDPARVEKRLMMVPYEAAVTGTEAMPVDLEIDEPGVFALEPLGADVPKTMLAQTASGWHLVDLEDKEEVTVDDYAKRIAWRSGVLVYQGQPTSPLHAVTSDGRFSASMSAEAPTAVKLSPSGKVVFFATATGLHRLPLPSYYPEPSAPAPSTTTTTGTTDPGTSTTTPSTSSTEETPGPVAGSPRTPAPVAKPADPATPKATPSEGSHDAGCAVARAPGAGQSAAPLAGILVGLALMARKRRRVG
jgi:hypothetical protein